MTALHKRSVFALVALFLYAQAFSLVHMAEHGFGKHEHGGHVCEVYLHAEASKYADTAPPVILPRPVFAETYTPPFMAAHHTTPIATGIWTRAPPVILST